MLSKPVPLSKPLQVCLLSVPPSMQSGTQAMAHSLVQFSKSLLCWLESDACMHSSGAGPEAHKHLHGVTFLRSPPLRCLLYFPVHWVFPSWSSGQKAGVLVNVFCHLFPDLCPNLGPSSKKAERDSKATRFHVTLLGLQLLQSERKIFLPQFSVLEGPTAATGTTTTTAGLPGH